MCVCSIGNCSLLELLTTYGDYLNSDSPSHELTEERNLALLNTECLTQIYAQYLLNKHYFKILK